MKTILITGINGYLGSSLARSLKNNYNIIGLEYSISNLFRIADLDIKVHSVENGIDEIFDADQPIDIIIHTATFYGRQNEEIATILNANLIQPLNLLDLAIKAGCKLFINTDTVLDRFVSSYALTKRHFQEWLYSRKNEIKVVNIILEHFYGPGANNTNFIISMIEKMVKPEIEIKLTLGEQSRNFVYIDDVVSGYIKIIENVDSLDNEYNNFEICSKENITIKELVLLIKDFTNSPTILNFGAIEYRENELMSSNSDNSKLINLGWNPEISIKKGINNMIKDYIKSHN